MVALRHIVLTSLLVSLSTQQTVKLTVYYDVEARDSIDFITRQLYPTYLTLNEKSIAGTRFKVELVPYIEAKSESTLVSSCRSINSHACLVTKIHACAVATIDDEWRRLNFVHCLLVDEYYKAVGCAASACVDDTPIMQCVNTMDGDFQMIHNSNRTDGLLLPTPLSLPVVTLNGAYKADEQYMARLNLLALVCDKFRTRFAAHCDTWRARKTMTHGNFGTNYFYTEKRKCSY